MKRRNFLISASTAGILAGLASGAGVGYASSSKNRPLALVYRGPAAYPGCSEAVAALLSSAPTGFRIQFCGPDENVQPSADALAAATIYAQPGGGEVKSAWRSLRAYSDDVRDFVNNGGRYLGFCLGAYLAGGNPGFGLLTGVAVESHIRSAKASVRGTDGTVVGVTWRGQRRHMYFQDGAHFRLQGSAPATVLATYDSGAAAAVITACGAGRVGLVGPHPEADLSWYTNGMANPDGIHFDLGHDLIESTIN
ncbi:BPL-N domain-containing protein [Dactylosporangium fulvum]|uniref:BPL-N domain-containing protein n=1 Tax=Dactylosporangium fulvum TaxID=53359 RepID=A0ABY5WBI3_9ACTN|nr:BPL-N domain-containing protein [Dactylosporangium fulvum]UWP86584.1 BPL-N domain-containing protein [Dactylosporangium fulvum]